MAQAQQQMTAQQANMGARGLIVNSAVRMTQQIFSTTVVPANVGNVVNVAPRNVGLILGFWVECNFTLNGDAMTATLTSLGAFNCLSNIQFNDLNNNVRINTAGWHLGMLASAKGGKPWLSCDTLDTYPADFDYNFTNLIQAPPTEATGNNFTVNMMYWVPLAYSDTDLRGAVYANVVNATMNLQLTINPTPGVNSGDATLAIYSGSGTNLTIVSANINVYQVYYDQLPVTQKGQVLLPILDLSTIYEIKNTALTGMTANQDFPISYSNFRDFLSTFFIYDNGGTLNVGSDINYLTLQSANFTNILKVAPKYFAAWARQAIGIDYPPGVYYLPTRNKPISTVQYGNMEFVLNASDVQANAVALMGYEAFALTNILPQAASLNT